MMKKRFFWVVFAFVLGVWACKTIGPPDYTIYPNPPMPGFNLAGSDTVAIRLADEVMNSVGGRKAWDEAHYLKWTFFGRRTLVWDKWAGRVRVTAPSKGLAVVVNLADKTGLVFRDRQLETNPDTIAKYLNWGYEVWVNDSYWLVMPFKMKDSGVTLKYLGVLPTKDDVDADVVEMTFSGVGVTPENKYRVYINQSSKYITQWDFFSNVANEKPDFTGAWLDYRPAAGLMFSTNRGDGGLSDICNFKEVPDSTWTGRLEPNWTSVLYPPKKKKKK